MNASAPHDVQGQPRWRWALDKLLRYAIAAIGPIGTAATHLLLSLVMLRLLTPTDFGAFTFLLVATQLSWGMWSALFCAPLPVLLTQGAPEQRERSVAALLAISLLGAAASFLLFLSVALLLGRSSTAATLFAGFGALSLLRWFGRAYGYAHGAPLRTTVSDVSYSLTLMLTLATGIWGLGWAPEIACYTALLTGAAIGLLPFGRKYFRAQVAGLNRDAFRHYAPILRDHARWALLGVLTTEATANAHVYLVTALKGPTAFAPIAASSLLMRPVNVAQNALSDFERPQIARQVANGEIGEIRRSLGIFRLSLGSIWLATVALAAVLFVTDPRLLFPATYDLDFLITASALWAAVAALRLIQIPESTMMQAAGDFRPLALASLWSAIGSIVAVLVLIPLAGTLWSIMGIVVGAAIYLHWTHLYAKRWMRGFEARL